MEEEYRGCEKNRRLNHSLEICSKILGGFKRSILGYTPRREDFSRRGSKWTCRERSKRFLGYAWGYGLRKLDI